MATDIVCVTIHLPAFYRPVTILRYGLFLSKEDYAGLTYAYDL